jgi:hypothetical protein
MPFPNLISTIHIRFNGLYLSTFGDMDGGKGGRVSPYGALFLDVIPPTQSRQHKGSVLLTCSGRIGSQRAGDVGAARAVFDGGGVLSRWLSGPKGVVHSFLVLASSSLSDQLLQLVKNYQIFVVARVRRV